MATSFKKDILAHWDWIIIIIIETLWLTTNVMTRFSQMANSIDKMIFQDSKKTLYIEGKQLPKKEINLWQEINGLAK